MRKYVNNSERRHLNIHKRIVTRFWVHSHISQCSPDSQNRQDNMSTH